MAQIEDIYNYVKISDVIATSGQPTEAQLGAISEAGYQVVINLALPTSNNALANERDLVENLGLEYIAIPVEWESPTLEAVEHFFNVMQMQGDRPVFVHCAANMRVSAFMYLYRILYYQVEPSIAAADLHRIWKPNDTWQQFINSTLKLHQS